MAATTDNDSQRTQLLEQIIEFNDTTAPIQSKASPIGVSIHQGRATDTTTDGIRHPITGIISRPFEFGEFLITTANPQGYKLVDIIPEEVLSLSPQIQRKMDFFKFYNGKIIIELRFNPQMAQFCLLGITQQRAYKYSQRFYNSVMPTATGAIAPSLTQLTSEPTEYIDFKTHNTIMVDMDYYAPFLKYDVTKNQGNWGRLLVYPIVPLNDVSTTGSVNCTMIMHLFEPELYWPTSLPTFSTTLSFKDALADALSAIRELVKIDPANFVNKNEPQNLRKDFLSKFANRTTSYQLKPHVLQAIVEEQGDAAPLVTINTTNNEAKGKTTTSTNQTRVKPNKPPPPEKKPDTELISIHAGGRIGRGIMTLADKFLSIFGLCKDRIHAPISLAKQQLLGYANNYDGPTDAHVMGLAHDNALSPINLMNDKTSTFDYLCGKEVWIRNVDITVGAPPTNLFMIKNTMWPNVAGPLAQTYAPTPYQMVANNFQLASGNFEYTVRMVSTPFHAVRIQLLFDPSNDLTDFPSTNLVYNKVVDLDPVTNSCSFTCEWAQNSLFNARPIDLTTNVDQANTYNGFFAINSYTSLRATNVAPDHITLAIFVKVTNPKFACFMPSPYAPYLPSVTIPEEQGDSDPIELGEFKTQEIEPNQTTLNLPSRSISDKIFDYSAGENVKSIEALLQGYSIFYTFPDDMTVPANNLFIINPWYFFFAQQPDGTSHISLVPIGNSIDNLDQYVPMFAAWRGSMEISVDISDGMDIAKRWSVALLDRQSVALSLGLDIQKTGLFPIQPSALTPAQAFCSTRTQHQFEVNGLEGTINVNVPFYSTRSFCVPDVNPTKPEILDYNNNPETFLAIWPTHSKHNQSWVIPKGTIIRRRAGPDFQLGSFRGCPLLSRVGQIVPIPPPKI